MSPLVVEDDHHNCEQGQRTRTNQHPCDNPRLLVVVVLEYYSGGCESVTCGRTRDQRVVWCTLLGLHLDIRIGWVAYIE